VDHQKQVQHNSLLVHQDTTDKEREKKKERKKENRRQQCVRNHMILYNERKNK